MCLAIPGEVIGIEGVTGEVSFLGACRKVNLSLVPGVKLGDYVLVHAGCAIQTLPADEALETLKLFEEVMGTDHE
jgi:hydrogenase expression/formation protein HypC